MAITALADSVENVVRALIRPQIGMILFDNVEERLVHCIVSRTATTTARDTRLRSVMPISISISLLS